MVGDAKHIAKMKKTLVEKIKQNPDRRDLKLLASLISLYEKAIDEHKIDAATVGAFGILYMFDSAPVDCNAVNITMVELPNGDIDFVLSNPASQAKPPKKELK